MKFTEKLLLKLPEPTEFVLVEDFNENFTKIDTEIAKITDEEKGVEAQLAKHLDQRVGRVLKGSRDASLAGVQTITLTDGLLPKKIVVNAWVNHTKKWSRGVWIDNRSGGLYSDNEGNIADNGNYVIVIENAVNLGGATTTAIVKNITKASFDLEWALTEGGTTGVVSFTFEIYYHGDGEAA